MKQLPRLGAVVSMVIVTLVALVTVAAPAQADGGYKELAFPRITNDMPAVWHKLNRHLWVDGCPGCPGPLAEAIDFAEYPSLAPRQEDAYLDSFTTGLAYLHDAAQVTDPAKKGALRTAAVQSFAKAAGRLGASRVGLRQVGTADFVRNVFEPTSNRWLTSAGIDLADGLSLMQQALPAGYNGEYDYPGPPPGKEPIIVKAMSEFDEAYTELVEQTSIGLS